MFKRLLGIRYIVVVIVILAALHALAFLALGTQQAIRAYAIVLHAGGEGHESRPGLELLHSIDFLFVSLVFVILALGIAKLFLYDPSDAAPIALPKWLQIESVSELKVLLWETILTTLLIVAMSNLTEGIFKELSWTVLLTPAATLLFALSLFFMKRA